MVSDYISTSFASDALAFPAVAVASPPSGGLLAEATFTATGGLAALGGTALAPTRWTVQAT